MNREGLRWDRGFAGFRPAVSGVITEGNLEITGNPVEDVAVKAMMIIPSHEHFSICLMMNRRQGYLVI